MLETLPSTLIAGVIGFSVALLLLPALPIDQLRINGRSHAIVSELQKERTTLLERLQRRLERSQAGINAAHYLLLSLASGLITFWLSNLILQSWWMAAPAFFAGVLFAERFINMRSTRRKERFEAGNVRAMRIMASSLRTSPSYLHAFEQVANSPFIESEVADEYRRVVELVRAQVPLDVVMKDFYLRTDSPDVSDLATIVQVQKELGGDMAKTLDLAASSILRRRQVQRRQKAAMSQILAQVNLLSAMPFLFVFTLFINNPHHFEPLTKTTSGRFALIGCLLSILLGGEVIRYVALKQFRRGGKRK